MTLRSGLTRRAWHHFLTVLVAIAAANVAAPRVAAGADVYQVDGVAVDVTAASAATAREQAIRDGERKAFGRLLDRLTRDPGSVPPLDEAELTGLIADFSIRQEKTSAVRYVATLDFRFKADAVQELLQSHGVRYVEAFATPVVVVPVFKTAGRSILWDDPNPWRDVWYGRGADSAAAPIIVPDGDLEDIAAIGAEQAIDGDAAAIIAIARRAGTEDALVTVAEMSAATGGQPTTAMVKSTHYTSGRPLDTYTVTIDGQPGEPAETVLARAADAVSASLQEQRPGETVIDSGQSGVVTAVVPVTGLPDWLSVRTRLERIPMIQEMDVILLTRREVRLNLHFLGSIEQLAEALRASALDLVRDGDMWIVRPEPAPAPRRT
ncbi:MAG: DUF2066 domain-containing protein [Rhodospirillales bacterium]|nr:DUF2066 domain-containing protein [Rhodospirillales bacterium]